MVVHSAHYPRHVHVHPFGRAHMRVSLAHIINYTLTISIPCTPLGRNPEVDGRSESTSWIHPLSLTVVVGSSALSPFSVASKSFDYCHSPHDLYLSCIFHEFPCNETCVVSFFIFSAEKRSCSCCGSSVDHGSFLMTGMY